MSCHVMAAQAAYQNRPLGMPLTGQGDLTID
jgi:hypothetical protein